MLRNTVTYEYDANTLKAKNEKSGKRKHPILRLLALLLGAGSLATLYCFNRATSSPLGVENAANFLIIGTDKAQGGFSRSDTVLLAHVELSPRKVTLLSLPRDTKVQIPGKQGFSKLNAAYATQREDPIARVKKTVEANFGVQVDHTVVLDTEGMGTLVDALGGVDVDIPQRMKYNDNAQNLHIDLQPGRRHLSGQEAVWFCRFRSDGRGDIGRVARQQSFLKELARQSLTPQLLLHWGRVSPALAVAVKTDLSTGQMLGLAKGMQGFKPEEMYVETLPGQPAYQHGVSYFIADKNANISALLKNTRPYTPNKQATRKLSGLSTGIQADIQVYNGTRQSNLAKHATQKLNRLGCPITIMRNATPRNYTRTTIVAPTMEIAQAVKDILQVGTCVENPSKKMTMVTLGSDYAFRQK
jgi:polyisoprenyl-teichoic acid--peptidoglycan teichoic acid transferase